MSAADISIPSQPYVNNGNVNDSDKGASFHSQNEYDTDIAVQEHCLAPYNLDCIINFNSEFQCLGWSSMTEKLISGFLVGRPFGGLGLLIRKSLNIKVSVIDIMQNCRVAALYLNFPKQYKLLTFIVYFPWQR